MNTVFIIPIHIVCGLLEGLTADTAKERRSPYVEHSSE